jgi:hypothetical protein
VDFGTTSQGTPVDVVFTVSNVGTQNLTLSGPISVPAGFNVASSFGTTTVTPGASTTFTVRLDGSSMGDFSGTLSFGSNDADEGTFDFSVAGTVSGVTRALDNGDAGFTTVGTWGTYSGGYLDDHAANGAGSGSETASWTFSALPAGTYRVSVTYREKYNRATDAPYTVYDGVTSRGTVDVNQQIAESDRAYDGVMWHDLGTFVISGGTLLIELSDNADGAVTADGVLIQQIA